tara:strand:- start:28909 stop:29919 length:1011 start_codon:yes stop_codon:yes gene_type:complete
MFLDKYQIKTYDEFYLNKNILPKIKNYFKDDNIFNSVLFGPNDNGKYTIAKSILYDIYGDDIYNIKETFIKINVNGTYKEIKVYSSIYHYEIYLNNYLLNDRISLSMILSSIAQNMNINTLSYNIIIIKNAQYLSMEIISIVKDISEKYSNSIRFILTTNNISKLNNVLTNFFYLRIPKDTNEIFVNYFKHIVEEEDINIKDKELIEIINNKKGIKSILLALENIHLSKKYDNIIKNEMDIWLQDVFNIIIGKKKLDIDKLRELIYNIITKNIDKIIIYHYLLDKILSLNLLAEDKNEVIKIIAKYEHRSRISYKDIIHLEALIINLTYIFNTFNL